MIRVRTGSLPPSLPRGFGDAPGLPRDELPSDPDLDQGWTSPEPPDAPTDEPSDLEQARAEYERATVAAEKARQLYLALAVIMGLGGVLGLALRLRGSR